MNCLLHLRFGSSAIQRLSDTRGALIERRRGEYLCLAGTKRAERREGMGAAAMVIQLLVDFARVGSAAQDVLKDLLLRFGG